MRLLLDTHILLWWLDDSPELAEEAREAIATRDNLVYVSSVSVWEIVIKTGLGTLGMPEGWSDALAEEPFRRMNVTWEHALRVDELPDIHKDPFDRLLIAQAGVEDLTLVTHDQTIISYGGNVLKA